MPNFAALSQVMDTQLSARLRDGVFDLRLGEVVYSVDAALSTVSDIYEGGGHSGSRLRSDDPVLTLLANQLNGETRYRDFRVEVNNTLYGIADYALNEGWLTLFLARQPPSSTTEAAKNRRIM